MIPSIELLESRIAPAALNAAGTLLTYTDLDGDFVKVSFTKTTMSDTDFLFSTGGVDGTTTTPQSLGTIILAGKTGAGFTLTAAPKAGKGDSHANIGNIDGTGTDLGTISVDGDVSFISAGVQAPGTVGLKSFTALSMGKQLTTSGLNDHLWNVASFTIKTDVVNETLQFNGAFKTLSIGGDLAETISGGKARIVSFGNFGSLTIGGSIVARDGGLPNLFLTNGTTASAVKIGGSILGGFASSTGPQVYIIHSLKSFTVGHDIIGGRGGGGLVDLEDVGTLKIGGSLIASDNLSSSGFIFAHVVGSFSIGGDIRGGDLTGGASLLNNGGIRAQNIGTFKLGGDLIAGRRLGAGTFNDSCEIAAYGVIGSITIGGSVRGDATNPARIFAGANDTTGPVNAIKSLNVRHSVEYASIFSGHAPQGNPGNDQSGIGSVTIGGNLSGSHIIVGSGKGIDGIPGNGDDLVANTIATLGSVKIGGAFTGIAGSGATYFIYGPHVKKLTVGKATYGPDALHAQVSFNTIGNATAQSVY